jgi:hypothetical protein
MRLPVMFKLGSHGRILSIGLLVVLMVSFLFAGLNVLGASIVTNSLTSNSSSGELLTISSSSTEGAKSSPFPIGTYKISFVSGAYTGGD